MSESKMPLPPGMDAAESPVMDLDGAELAAANEEMPVEIPKPLPKKKIKVVANRPGFIFSERKNVGDKFEVMQHELGSWMDCEDPHEQKQHLLRLKAKKQKVNAGAIRDQDKSIAAVE